MRMPAVITTTIRKILTGKVNQVPQPPVPRQYNLDYLPDTFEREIKSINTTDLESNIDYFRSFIFEQKEALMRNAKGTYEKINVHIAKAPDKYGDCTHYRVFSEDKSKILGAMKTEWLDGRSSIFSKVEEYNNRPSIYINHLETITKGEKNPEYKGIGTILIDQVKKLARSETRGRILFEAEAPEGMPSPVEFYHKMGFGFSDWGKQQALLEYTRGATNSLGCAKDGIMHLSHD